MDAFGQDDASLLNKTDGSRFTGFDALLLPNKAYSDCEDGGMD